MVLTCVIATYADRVFSDRSNGPRGAASQLQNARLPCRPRNKSCVSSEASVRGLSPVVLSARGGLTSELLRFL
jgi:hypothetical protein